MSLQLKHDNKHLYASLSVLYGLSMTLLYSHAHYQRIQPVIANSTVEVKDFVTSSPNPTSPTIKTQKQLIQDYIKLKFGKHSKKAFLLLKGNGKCGGENQKLDPNAIYVNKDGSKDRGIFQISSKWHSNITDKCAFDYKCNINYAFRMFKNDNNTFIRWTAGKCIGI